MKEWYQRKVDIDRIVAEAVKRMPTRQSYILTALILASLIEVFIRIHRWFKRPKGERGELWLKRETTSVNQGIR